ncbi:MAG: glycosyltransferase [Firmicutes bacterium]|nr:glycosyltransferase [Bacillota bacterium]
MKYSVLMSVYKGEKAEFFKLSLKSMFEQTVAPEQVVVVCDGELTHELDRVLSWFEKKYPEIMCIHRLERNMGTGYAANEGLKLCRNELIAKMDSDDIAYLDRCEKQLAEFEKDEKLDMLGGYVSEFEGSISNEKAVKKVPTIHGDIIKYAKRRNPFNNQTLMYKKTKAVSCGGYTCNTRCEDYDFIVKMIMNGAKCQNVPENLVHYRLDSGAYERRKNWKNTVGFVLVRYRNWKRGFCSFTDFLLPCAAQMLLFLLPVAFTKKLYIKVLRKKV